MSTVYHIIIDDVRILCRTIKCFVRKHLCCCCCYSFCWFTHIWHPHNKRSSTAAVDINTANPFSNILFSHSFIHSKHVSIREMFCCKTRTLKRVAVVDKRELKSAGRRMSFLRLRPRGRTTPQIFLIHGWLACQTW